MSRVVESRVADKMFYYFEEISKIPHGSENEEAIADYIVAFAKERGLDCCRDVANNVLVRKGGTAGRENEPILALQGHTDMVCEKNPDVAHCFETDPLKLVVENGYLRASGTTLGADDGVAVAIMLAILDGEAESHPPLECLFTSGEEIGMIGAGQFDFSKLTAKRLINLDSECESVVTAGCAGGIRSEITLAGKQTENESPCLTLTLSGLHGGHSGEDISKGRANANRLMARILLRFLEDVSFRLVRISGGSKDNAIPRDCEATFAIADIAGAEERIAAICGEIVSELSSEDKNFAFAVTESSAGQAFDHDFSERLVALMNYCDNGVYAMSTDITGLVEWSGNMGVVETGENGGRLVFLTRSSTESRIDESIARIEGIARLFGGTASHHGRYPGWRYCPVSPLRDKYIEVCKRLHGLDVVTTVIHAGLECGLIYKKCPEMDLISIGPDIKDIHSPAERIGIAGAERFWLTVLEMLK